MKPSVRLAGILGSAAFLLVSFKAYMSTQNPLHSMLYGIAATIVLAFVGFQIGNILAHPKGPRHPKRKQAHAKKPGGVTGEEVFLEDIPS